MWHWWWLYFSYIWTQTFKFTKIFSQVKTFLYLTSCFWKGSYMTQSTLNGNSQLKFKFCVHVKGEIFITLFKSITLLCGFVFWANCYINNIINGSLSNMHCFPYNTTFMHDCCFTIKAYGNSKDKGYRVLWPLKNIQHEIWATY